ncbi:PREDICTED: uncharacterized protein LOC109154396 [Ipomoea nil]|uniref:uncharacterized protein LOC109154396 n=1 Tax=Ipomoea nil TaxID=35883 RepID=UPI00090113AF|nr:PREDICTED: uncharacterized protein LOC109154396 [Ipomoea nil]
MVARDHAERLRVKIEFDGLFYIDNVGVRGGMALLWRKNNTASLLGYSKNHVDVEVCMPGFDKWRMTGFYGFAQRWRRNESWELIRSLSHRSQLQWVMIGDFNDLLYQHEKRGGNPHPEALLRGFGKTIDECGLAQLPMQGYPYTWERGEGTVDWIEERLDKVLVTQEWREVVRDASVLNILTRRSDHSALFLGILNPRERRNGMRRRFRFEMAWLHDEGCRGVVERTWAEGRNKGLQGCIQLCGDRLSRWGGDRFHKFGEQAMNLRKQQLRLRGCMDQASLAKYQRLEGCLAQIEMQEDAYWKQWAKQHWLKGADANTKFYHRYASHHKKKNTLVKIMNDDGDWVEGEAMGTVIIDYYRRIFATGQSENDVEFYASIFPQVSQAQNDGLLRPFDKTEVKAALTAMFPDKAPDPDGMNLGFYQNYWDVVGEDVSEFIVNCLNTRTFPAELNDTDIVLIPKKKNLELVSDLRPIALSNVIYRIMAKMISARMKPLMNEIISDTQSAFIPDRLITDNILVAAEVGHFLNRKQCGMTGWGALKLDMAKAYDRMEWSFLRNMLIALGFDARWMDLIMLCVTTVSYNILLNGSRSLPITPTRGLRQGDPLPPYLFIICAEGLSLLLQQAQSQGRIHGCRVARGAPPISHLLFADDSLLFFKAKIQEAEVIKQCLTRYERLSGQVVNYHKSNICYSKNTRDDDRNDVAHVLGVDQAPNYGKYLGLPSFIGRNKKTAFSYIEDKIRQRIVSCNKKLLSQAGKEVLLKSVAQAMPTFSMSVFLLPMGICTAIERTMNRYWWGSGNDRGIHWKAWDKMCIPKKHGGLGFKELHAFNLAMLGKQAWRLLTKPESLVSKVYKARYYPKGTFYDTCVGNNPSFCWRSIMAAHDMVCRGIRRRIGNGDTTLIWDHPWLQDQHEPKIHTEKPVHLNGATIKGLIDPETHTWDPNILTDIFDPIDIPRILKIPISPNYDDMWYWYGDQGGNYTVKNGYMAIIGDYGHATSNFDNWLGLWILKIPPKWKTFLWRALNDILPTTTLTKLSTQLQSYITFGEPEMERCGMHAYHVRKE